MISVPVGMGDIPSYDIALSCDDTCLLHMKEWIVGVNIHEAQYAQSKKDFIAKLEIALKESSETCYWLKLMLETKRIDSQTYQYAEKLCGNIRRLLIASCKTAKENV